MDFIYLLYVLAKLSLSYPYICVLFIYLNSQDKCDCIKQLFAVALVYLLIKFIYILFTNLNYMVFINHMHGLIFKLKKRMNSRQDQPVIYLFI